MRGRTALVGGSLLVMTACGHPSRANLTEPAGFDGARVDIGVDAQSESVALNEGRAQLEVPAHAPDQQVEIPPASPADWRGPLERFLGVPDDLAAATQWDHDLMEIAIGECMRSNGFEYVEVPFGSASDPNEAVYGALDDDQLAAYSLARWGFGEESSCEAVASDRVHVLNALGDLYAPYEARFAQDPRVVAAQAEIRQCVVDDGGDPDDPRSPFLEGCAIAAEWESVRMEVVEEVQTDFVNEHSAELQAFVDERPSLDRSEQR